MYSRTIASIVSALVGAVIALGVTSAQAATKEQSRPFVRVSYIPGSVALPVLVGIERGFFEREGLVVSALPVTNQQAIVNSLAQGYTDVACGSQAWLLDMANAKAPIKVIALNGYARKLELVVPSWDKKTKNMKDLTGKTVLIVRGTHNFDVVPEFYRMLAFSRMPLGAVSIRFITLSEFRAIFNPKSRVAYLKQKIGGILAYQEYTGYYRKKKLARAVINNEQITKLIGRISPRPLIANANFLKKNKMAAQKFVTAWVKTLKYIEKNKKDAATVLMIYYGRQYGVTLQLPEAEEIVSLIKYDKAKWTDTDTKAADINARAISAARNILFSSVKDKSKRPFRVPPKVDDLIDSEFVDRALSDLKAAALKRDGNNQIPKGKDAKTVKGQVDTQQNHSTKKRDGVNK